MSSSFVRDPGSDSVGKENLLTFRLRPILRRRGDFVTAALGLTIFPWELLLTGRSVFLTVLSSFAVFLGPLTICLRLIIVIASDTDGQPQASGPHGLPLLGSPPKQTSPYILD
ncbi:hypothetical protein L226DRAFT_317563 [Lentinus tigrinus ALCF2SS1-7]|uniref:Uncharacterized protein n=1 Tax=Lentinus tigrinus ALCF2SS1-6 TaxID=1328759 RepID=A0A5C2RP73_9APHY|nr:hypothetical protein L227DRAFT_399360 [Lentinus tigrinus ALCF2SS1-6]RPD68667.1 hypothetical protein L226DRAFT_317563 [Lentinus tigrinus ALCF2SS1-7]